MKFGNLVEICLWLDLTLKGLTMKFYGVTIQLKSTGVLSCCTVYYAVRGGSDSLGRLLKGSLTQTAV